MDDIVVVFIVLKIVVQHHWTVQFRFVRLGNKSVVIIVKPAEGEPERAAGLRRTPKFTQVRAVSLYVLRALQKC